MWKQVARRNMELFFKAGLPYTLAGMVIIFAGIYGLQILFAESEHLSVILFTWIGLFWVIYQPLFRSRIRKYAHRTERTDPR